MLALYELGKGNLYKFARRTDNCFLPPQKILMPLLCAHVLRPFAQNSLPVLTGALAEVIVLSPMTQVHHSANVMTKLTRIRRVRLRA